MRTKNEINKKLDEISELWRKERTADPWMAGVCEALEWVIYVDIPYSKLYPEIMTPLPKWINSDLQSRSTERIGKAITIAWEALENFKKAKAAMKRIEELGGKP